MVLNEQSLSDCMSALVWNGALVEKYYKPFSLLRKEDDVSILLLLLENLSNVQFKMQTNDPALDEPEYWTTLNVLPSGRKAVAQASRAGAPSEGSFFSIFSAESSPSSSAPPSPSPSSTPPPSSAALSSASSAAASRKEKEKNKKDAEYDSLPSLNEIPQDEPSPPPQRKGDLDSSEDRGISFFFCSISLGYLFLRIITLACFFFFLPFK